MKYEEAHNVIKSRNGRPKEDDWDLAEAAAIMMREVDKLREVMRELLITGIALEALLADEPSSVYIHPEIWTRLKEHRGHLRRGLLMLTQESESE